METLPCFFLCSLSIISLSLCFLTSDATDTIVPNQVLSDGETLVSSGQSFELGFFTPDNTSDRRYVGIWYKHLPQTVVWVANRERAVIGSDGVLTISNDGNLVLLNATKSIIWSVNSSKLLTNPIARLLDSGNLVLGSQDDDLETNYAWQSFDYPADNLLPGMKLGWDQRSGLDRMLTSWRSPVDPSPGVFTYRVDMYGLPQVVLRDGSQKIFTGGLWNGLQLRSITGWSYSIVRPNFVFNETDVYYIYGAIGDTTVTRLALDPVGMVHRWVLNQGTNQWVNVHNSPADTCDDYAHCAANGICKVNLKVSAMVTEGPVCDCIVGFTPKSPDQWQALVWSDGCKRNTPLGCQTDGFIRGGNLKLPQPLEFWKNKSMSHQECRAECLRNCSCTAFASLNTTGRSSGCLIWFGDLIDIREYTDGMDQEFYIRVPASELRNNRKRKMVIAIVVCSASAMLFLCLLTSYFCTAEKRRKNRVSQANKEDIELPLFDLPTITTATKNFCHTMRIGEGGFGAVYKGTLSTGQEIAVKRLSKNSGQGLQEFKNEIILISKLQHRNLVRLLGCFLDGEERMLVYEYMPNKSLDYFIFDKERRLPFTWKNRFEIAIGVGKGLLYLHQDSRFRIIHRDLKASNILLDNEMKPKISDFGIARIFGGDQNEAKTKHVVGTYGYMSPEYAIDGKFSVKSDVFSFGVLLLEIISGKRNTRYHHPDHHHSLLGHAWMLWKESKELELMDISLKDSYVESQVQRCIQVGLLCVQKFPKDRPTMSSVVVMLDNEGVTLPQPKLPGFFVERSSMEMDVLGEKSYLSDNSVTVTTIEAR